MSNNLTKDVEFMNKSTSREIVFDGTYTAKKGDIKLNEFALSYASATDVYGTTDKVTFYVYVDDMDTAANDADAKYDNVNKKYVATNTFDNVLVENGKSVRVKVEAEVEAEHPTLAKSVALGKYEFKVWGEDEHGNTPSGEGKANTTAMKVVENGSVNVSTSTTKQTIIRKANDAVVAEFIVKPGNDASSVTLEEIQFNIA